jgi:hypothetical protein
MSAIPAEPTNIPVASSTFKLIPGMPLRLYSSIKLWKRADLLFVLDCGSLSTGQGNTVVLVMKAS